ncbi:MAG: riboflavin kinase / adenylyltransferase [Gaiellales bacterium]|nr:riboflavin kinase / adenylyltransferase [Gaiellales bacterium]
MKIVRDADGCGLEQPGVRRAVALGTFDGVHMGHRALISEVIVRARELDARASVATFDPMPLEVLRPSAAPLRLSTLEQRAALIAEQDPDELLIVRFDARLSALEPVQFVEQTLVRAMGAVWVVIGENFRFGRGAVGDAAVLAELGTTHGFGVSAVPLQRIDGERVSSSWIRELVSKGEVDHAARLLGRDPWLEGVVERGDARGRELGVPTANLAIERTSVRPARGVYAGMAVLQDGQRIPAAISVGWNPTFGEGRPLTVEAHLLDFSGDLYDQPLRLEFRKFLRHELRFEDIDELIAQMKLDIEQTRQLTRDG